MSDLRQATIKLAHEHPELRKHLVPLLRKDAGVVDWIKEKLLGMKFTHPETGNKVRFNSLPPEEQKKIRERMKQKEREKIEAAPTNEDEMSDLHKKLYKGLDSAGRQKIRDSFEIKDRRQRMDAFYKVMNEFFQKNPKGKAIFNKHVDDERNKGKAEKAKAEKAKAEEAAKKKRDEASKKKKEDIARLDRTQPKWRSEVTDKEFKKQQKEYDKAFGDAKKDRPSASDSEIEHSLKGRGHYPPDRKKILENVELYL